MRNAWPFLFALALGACADACDGGAPQRSSAPRHAEPAASPLEPRPEEGPPPAGEPVAPHELEAALPPTVGAFAPSSEPSSRRVEMANRGSLTSARRTYAHEDTTLTLEITDTLHAPQARALIERGQALANQRGGGTFEGMQIQGYDSVTRWHAPDKTGLVNVLVEGRYLVNLHVRPTDDAALGGKLAAQVPLSPLLELQRRHEDDGEQASGPGAQAADGPPGAPTAETAEPAAQAEGAATQATATPVAKDARER